MAQDIFNVPQLSDLQAYNVNRAGQVEGIRQSLYDFQTYDKAGTTQLAFFQTPLGQGGKTYADTNMNVAGSLPAPKSFLVESIELRFYSGADIDTFTVAAAALPGQADDLYAFGKGGWLDFFIGSKSYLTEAPLDRFPAKSGLRVHSALATNSATVGEIKSEYAILAGEPYMMAPPILLVPTQNFNITLNWPAAVPMPSTKDARVGVILNGILYRNSQ